jgi:hypothetical protein
VITALRSIWRPRPYTRSWCRLVFSRGCTLFDRDRRWIASQGSRRTSPSRFRRDPRGGPTRSRSRAASARRSKRPMGTRTARPAARAFRWLRTRQVRRRPRRRGSAGALPRRRSTRRMRPRRPAHPSGVSRWILYSRRRPSRPSRGRDRSHPRAVFAGARSENTRSRRARAPAPRLTARSGDPRAKPLLFCACPR